MRILNLRNQLRLQVKHHLFNHFQWHRHNSQRKVLIQVCNSNCHLVKSLIERKKKIRIIQDFILWQTQAQDQVPLIYSKKEAPFSKRMLKCIVLANSLLLFIQKVKQIGRRYLNYWENLFWLKHSIWEITRLLQTLCSMNILRKVR